MSRSDEKNWSGQYFWKKALCLTVIFVQYKKGLVIKKRKMFVDRVIYNLVTSSLL